MDPHLKMLRTSALKDNLFTHTQTNTHWLGSAFTDIEDDDKEHNSTYGSISFTVAVLNLLGPTTETSSSCEEVIMDEAGPFHRDGIRKRCNTVAVFVCLCLVVCLSLSLSLCIILAAKLSGQPSETTWQITLPLTSQHHLHMIVLIDIPNRCLNVILI